MQVGVYFRDFLWVGSRNISLQKNPFASPQTRQTGTWIHIHWNWTNKADKAEKSCMHYSNMNLHWKKILQVGVRHLVCYYCEERTTRRNRRSNWCSEEGCRLTKHWCPEKNSITSCAAIIVFSLYTVWIVIKSIRKQLRASKLTSKGN